MLHTGILPHHTNWAEFFRSLQIVVIDEMHSYRGVFGSHVANVLRRLKRVAHFYGARPQFILTSATIGNPAELAERLIEEKVTLIEQDGSARGPKSFLIYNPPVVDARLGLRASALGESLRLADDLLVNHVQTLLFARSRRTVELLLTYLRQRAPVGDPERSIRGYRSGYMPALRREIEAGLRRGEVRLVAATNALELGVDIGQMGAAVLVGFPGTIASARQQAGRAGRGKEHSLAVLVATPDPLDQFLAAHPEYFFERSPEQALINPDHLLILLGHLRCAAFELPFQEGEAFGRLPAQTLAEYLAYLQEEGVLHRSGPRYFWMADQYPAQSISLRSASSENILLRAQEGEDNPPYLVGQVDRESALWMVHPGAVYLHEGQSFLVNELDLEGRIAQLKPVSPDFYTEPIHQTDVEMIECLAQSAAAGCTRTYGELRVTDQVVGYRKLRWQTQEVLETNPLEMPVSELLTNGYWLALNEATVERLRQEGLWRNDPNQYGPTWKAQKERARARDGYRCQMCGAPESSKAHDVHHIVPFRMFSNYEQANVLSNLVTLCSTCHGRAETAVRVRSGLAGLSYVLTHLAPLVLDVRRGRPRRVQPSTVPAGRRSAGSGALRPDSSRDRLQRTTIRNSRGADRQRGRAGAALRLPGRLPVVCRSRRREWVGRQAGDSGDFGELKRRDRLTSLLRVNYADP